KGGLWEPMGIALQSALGGNHHFVDLGQSAEKLKEWTVSQPGGEIPKPLFQVGAQNIATQSAAGMLLKSRMGLDRGLPVGSLAAGFPLLHAQADELLFGAALR